MPYAKTKSSIPSGATNIQATRDGFYYTMPKPSKDNTPLGTSSKSDAEYNQRQNAPRYVKPKQQPKDYPQTTKGRDFGYGTSNNSSNTQKDDAYYDNLVKEVMSGKHGMGTKRKESLGDDYDEVQRRINSKYSKPKTQSKPTAQPSQQKPADYKPTDYEHERQNEYEANYNYNGRGAYDDTEYERRASQLKSNPNANSQYSRQFGKGGKLNNKSKWRLSC